VVDVKKSMELAFAKYGIGRSSVMLNDINERIYG